MRAQYFQKSIPLLFLLLFLGAKASAFHPLTHEEAEEPVPCEVCVLAIQQDLEDYDHPEIQALPDEELLPSDKEEQATYLSTPYLRETWMRYFSRPPPQLA
jgi:hypothetical protein